MKKFLFLGMALVFAAMFFSFGYLVVAHGDLLAIAPSLVGLIGTIFASCLFAKQVSVGDNTYQVLDGKLFLKNKKVDMELPKDEIHNVTFLCNRCTDKVEEVTFVHNNKKHRFMVTEDTTGYYRAFFGETITLKKRSLWYDILESFTF